MKIVVGLLAIIGGVTLFVSALALILELQLRREARKIKRRQSDWAKLERVSALAMTWAEDEDTVKYAYAIQAAVDEEDI